MKPFNFPDYCQAHQITYQHLADLCGISVSYACQLRLGRVPISRKIAKRLNAALGISLDVLLDGAPDRKAVNTRWARVRAAKEREG